MIFGIILSLSCLAGVGHGKQAKVPPRDKQSDPSDEHWKALKLADLNKRLSSDAARRFAQMLMAFNRAAVFIPTESRLHDCEGSPALASLGPVMMHRLYSPIQGVSELVARGDGLNFAAPMSLHSGASIARRAGRVQLSEGSDLAPTVVFGPGSQEMRLLIAKLAATAGHPSSIYAGDYQKDLDKRCRMLMYGRNASEAEVQASQARVLSTLEELGNGLKSMEVLCLVCDTEPLSEGTFALLLNQAPNVKRVVLVSKMGVTRAKPGLMGLGGKDAGIRAGEETIRKEVAQRGLELSIVRVGTLKGGGPGGNSSDSANQGTYDDDLALGLTKVYYDGIVELETYMTTQAHDKYTLGAKLTAGDPFDLPNPFMVLANRGSFDARDEDTNRIVAATAVVKALSFGKSVEMSVSSVKGNTLPTEEAWEDMFAQL